MIPPRNLPRIAVLMARWCWGRARLVVSCWIAGVTIADVRREMRLRQMRGDWPPRS